MADLFNNTNLPTINPPQNPFTTQKDDKQKEKKQVYNSGEQKISQNQDSDQNQSNFDFQEFLKQREAKIKAQERQRAAQQQYTERLIFNRKDQETRAEIEAIKTEIKTLIKMTKGISETLIETEKAVLTQSIETGSGNYYFSFFQRIKRLIRLAQKRLSESQYWLEIFNQRSKAKSYYWGQVGKSGTKFSQSHERAIVTQTD